MSWRHFCNLSQFSKFFWHLEEIQIEDKGAHIYITQCFSGKACKLLAISLIYWFWFGILLGDFFFLQILQHKQTCCVLVFYYTTIEVSFFFFFVKEHTTCKEWLAVYFNNQVWIVKILVLVLIKFMILTLVIECF
jgi:hypothetical protein